MAGLSDYAENELLDHVLGTGSYSMPTVYCGLYTAAPSDAGGGTEVTGAGYARKAAAFGAASGGATSNSGALTWTASGGNYGTVTHVGLFDAESSGNLLAWAALGTSRTINDGETLTIAIGELDVTLD